MPKGTETISTNATQGCVARLWYFVGALSTCASIVAPEEGWSAHEQLVQSGRDSDIFVGNSLIDMYAKCGSMEDAWRVFNNMPSCDVGLWKCHTWRMFYAWRW